MQVSPKWLQLNLDHSQNTWSTQQPLGQILTPIPVPQDPNFIHGRVLGLNNRCRSEESCQSSLGLPQGNGQYSPCLVGSSSAVRTCSWMQRSPTSLITPAQVRIAPSVSKYPYASQKRFRCGTSKLVICSSSWASLVTTPLIIMLN